MTKKLFCILLTICMLLCTTAAFAEDASANFLFALSVDGNIEKQAAPGDIITVSFALQQTDSDADYTMYAMQNEILYDDSFFGFVEDSAMTADGVVTTDLARRSGGRALYMNFASMNGGEPWRATTRVGSFQLQVIGTSGSSVIRNSNYLVSTQDGTDHFAATAQDVTVVVTTDCTVHFETNGGSTVPNMTVAKGSRLKTPEEPTRDGYHFVGWCKDLDLTMPWDFDVDVVAGNMTLYAKWSDLPVAAPAGTGGSGWILWAVLGVLLAAVIAAVLFFFFGKRTVCFDTCGGSEIPARKVSRNATLRRLHTPERDGCVFAGWYRDAAHTEPWDVQADCVKRSMTLFAKWE